jgi:hypothetical protein
VRLRDHDEPSAVLSNELCDKLLAPADSGPVSELFALLSSTLAEAYGPTLDALGVGKRDRIDPKAGLALRGEIGTWVGAFGMSSFELYVGGRSLEGITCVADATPRIIVGPGIRAPLDPRARSNLAAGLLALRRGTHVIGSRDDTTTEAICEVACYLARVGPKPRETTVASEVERLVGKALAKRTRVAIEPVCRQIVEARPNVRAWAGAAALSLARARTVAAGDPSLVAGDWLAEPPERLHLVAQEDLRVKALLQFALSPAYFEIRQTLGLGVERG